MATIDEQIGLKIKMMRKARGISQMELAGEMGVSFQQIQKYEKGATRLSVHRLRQISEALGVNIITFFQEAGQPLQVSGLVIGYGADLPDGQSFDHEGMTFLKLFRRIKSKTIKEGILKQLRGIVELEGQR